MSAAVDVCTPVWLDCDPGHDDAFALLLAGWHPALNLLGVSTVHGNHRVENTTLNALRILHAGGLAHIPVVVGAAHPLMRKPRFCPEVHGDSGMDGVDFPPLTIAPVPGVAIAVMYDALAAHARSGGPPVTLIATGCLTNVALLLSVYGVDALRPLLREIVLMGGALGRGNTGAVAEFNIQVDPEAAAIVFACGLPLAVVPLDVTHTALVTPEVLSLVATGAGCEVSRAGAYPHSPQGAPVDTGATAPHQGAASLPHAVNAVARAGEEELTRLTRLPHGINGDHHHLDGGIAGAAGELTAATPFRATLVSLLRFFAGSYRSLFFFAHPPLHDPCAVAFAIDRSLFASRTCRVDVETASPYAAGQTIVDLFGVQPSPGGPGALPRRSEFDSGGPNAAVALTMDVPRFWGMMLRAIQRADAASPLNGNAVKA